MIVTFVERENETSYEEICGNSRCTLLHTTPNNKLLLIWQYMDVPGETDEGQQKVSPLWPEEGAVEFNHVSLLYYPWLPPALNDVSFSIRPCEHVSHLLSLSIYLADTQTYYSCLRSMSNAMLL